MVLNRSRIEDLGQEPLAEETFLFSKSILGKVTAPNHACRAQCGGVSQGVYGTQDPGSGNAVHRIRPPCLAASASKDKGSESADGKRKFAQQGPGSLFLFCRRDEDKTVPERYSHETDSSHQSSVVLFPAGAGSRPTRFHQPYRLV